MGMVRGEGDFRVDLLAIPSANAIRIVALFKKFRIFLGRTLLLHGILVLFVMIFEENSNLYSGFSTFRETSGGTSFG